VTWISSNQQVATISAGGLASAVAAGTTTIIAQSGGLLATATLAVSITSSGTPNLTITPSSASETFTGETTQFFAVGNLTGVGSSQDLTSVVTWSSSNQQVATISAGGLATATGYGTTVITAKSGALSAVATLNVIQTATTPTTPTLNIIPGSLTFVGQGTGGTSQLLAFGNLVGNGAVKDLTNDVTWTSSDPAVASVSATGLVTSQISPKYGLSYSTTITAVGQTIGGSGSVITSTILVTVNSAITTAPAAAEPTLTIGFTGTITGNVTSAPTPGVNCGNGGAVCAMDYSANTAVTLTETPANGATFSGWSANCTAVTGSPNECTLQMTDSNITVTANYN